MYINNKRILNNKYTVEKTEGTLKNGQYRDTGIGHTKHRTKINKAHKHKTTQKTKKMSNTDLIPNKRLTVSLVCFISYFLFFQQEEN